MKEITHSAAEEAPVKNKEDDEADISIYTRGAVALVSIGYWTKAK